MSMHLNGADADMTISTSTWGKMLELAQLYGWQPAGTEAPRYWGDPEWGFDPEAIASWDGDNYYSNDYQIVTEQDAAAMARALAMAFNFVPESAAWSHPINIMDYHNLTPIDALSASRETVEEFIEFAQKGEFNIG